MLKRIIAFLVVIICLFSCSCYKHCPYSITGNEQKDSVYVKDSVFVRDTVIQYMIPEGTASAISQPSDTSRLKTGFAVSEAWIDKDGNIHHILNNRAGAIIPIKVSIPYRAHAEYRSQGITITRTVEVEKPLSKWQSFLIVSGTISFIIMILLLLFLAVRKFILRK